MLIGSSAQSNLSQNPAQPNAGGPRPAAGVPTNMAAGASAGNPLVGLTGARYAGHANLPGIDMFGADGGVRPLANSSFNSRACTLDILGYCILIKIVQLAIWISRRNEFDLKRPKG
jgi:hypothetical protein